MTPTASKRIFLTTFLLLAIRATGADVVFQTVRSFGQAGSTAPLIQATDGSLYGTSFSDGAHGAGTVFRLTTNGSLTVLHEFTGGADRANPFGGVIQGVDGNFYGTTGEEAAGGAGTVFRLTPTGVFTMLYAFTGLDDGSDPTGLMQASDGHLYGATLNNGANRVGTLFRLTLDGEFTTLHTFNGTANGAYPSGKLLQARDGNLYGTTWLGGTWNLGTVFRISPSGAFTVIRHFNGTNDGANPRAGLVEASDGRLYGTTTAGGATTNGTIFRITTSGEFLRLHSFAGGAGGRNPRGQLVQAPNGGLYGTTQYGGTAGYGTVFRISTNGVFAVFRSLTRNDGAYPFSGLLLAKDGNLYGTTPWEGAAGNGTAFRITPTGLFTLLRSFPVGYTGVGPLTSLTGGPDGRLYGTTLQGGSGNRGTIFSIGTDGTFKSLHAFGGGPADGATPRGALVVASDGNLYGTTERGGTSDLGTVYRITREGAFTLLRSFTGGTHGAYLWSGLVQGRDGSLYGTTGGGGANDMGTAFRMTLDGALTTLYSFNSSVGGGQRAPLIQGSDGAFYGTSAGGGANGQGTVYRLTPNGVLTLLRSFANNTNGYYPTAPLVQARDGRLYGTTDFGGARSAGTIFRITTNGVFSLFYTFNGSDGHNRPDGGLTLGDDGNFYGSTMGSQNSHGSVYRITTNGAFTSLYRFSGLDGNGEPAGVVLGDDGNLYGTTFRGGLYSAGTVFRVLIAPPVFQPPLLSGGNCLFSFGTVVRQRYTIEAKPDLSTAHWVVYTSLNGNGSEARIVVPTDYYPEHYFRIRRH